MKQFIPVILFTLGIILSTVAPASAQVPFTQSRSFSFSGRSGGVGAVGGQPTFSPYLNLLRGGNSTLLNYYGLVRPEQQFRAANQQFQSSLGQVQSDYQQQQQLIGDPNLLLPESGHQVQFQSNLRSPSRFGTSRSTQFGSNGQTASTGAYSIGPTGHSVSFGNNGNWFPAGTANPGLPSNRR